MKPIFLNKFILYNIFRNTYKDLKTLSINKIHRMTITYIAKRRVALKLFQN